MSKGKVLAQGYGELEVLCDHGVRFDPTHVPESGLVALEAGCDEGCGDVTLVGVDVSLGIAWDERGGV